VAAGSAYVFLRSGSSWGQQAKLTAADGTAADWFGSSVRLSGDGNTALVGAYGNDTPAGTDAGSAYVFVRSGSTWSQQAQLTADGGATADSFGLSVSLSADGNAALVGAAGSDAPAGVYVGSAHLYERSGSSWSQQAQLTAGDGAANDHFGYFVSLSGNASTALVGAVGDDTASGLNAGSAYVFRVSAPDGTPVLIIESSAASVIISWWPEVPGFELEATDSLGLPAWSPVAGSSPVTIPMTGPARFYRLKKR